MGAIKSKTGRWRYRKWVQLPSGKRVRIFGTPALNTKAAAERAEHAHIDRVLKPPVLGANGKPQAPLFKEFVDKRWLPVYPASVGNRPLTIEEKVSHVRVHLNPAFGHLRLDEIRGEAVAKFFATLRGREEPASNKTISNIRATLRTILVCAIEWDVLEAMPKLPRVKIPQAGYSFYDRTESDRLIAGARNAEDRALIAFALKTGARAGEQRAIEWADIDFVAKRVHFRKSLPCNAKKVGPTKSGNLRNVPLTPALAELLRGLKRGRSNALVFGDAKGKPLTCRMMHSRLRFAQRKAGLKRITWHSLRHSYATHLFKAGVPARDVQAYLGHSTLAMTMRYGHHAPSSGDAAAIALALDGVTGESGQPAGNEQPTETDA